MAKAKPKPTASATQQVVHADCVGQCEKLAGGSVHLAIADPPYNQGQPYDAYEDSKPYDEYLDWTRRWLGAVRRVLHRHGALWVFAPDEWVSEIDLMARKEFKFYKRNHVVWYFTFGQAQQGKFTRSHCHLLWLTATKTRFTFNPEGLRVPSARQAVYGDKRASPNGKLPDDTWVLHKAHLEPCFSPDMDTWLGSRVCGTFKAREKCSPNQIPVPIMERVVLAASNPGDLVLDPFCGTGSSGIACKLHGRNYLGLDVSKVCVKRAAGRILSTPAGAA